MPIKNKRQRQAKTLRLFRKIHRTLGACLFAFFFIVSITSLLLGWKKHSNGIILADSRQGASTDLKEWLPVNQLHLNANKIYRDSISTTNSLTLNRIDIRKSKGMVKFIYVDGFWGIQIDGATGELLYIEKRNGDIIEKIHDGSILDYYFETNNGQLKLVYTTIMSLALFSFTFTGFWLWLGPKRMRKE
ncbi:MAG: PepSY domain-containing protein [Cellulophaga sp.]